ncbi:RNA polymerase sigma factor [Cellvibrio fibrivorans]|uniref:RNA polymerase sigma-70 factor (ECF subfamily) n=2 Tax=Cellvibrio TaxID=10 RepID=A0ABU1UV33_9GAMM|nr:RNA polymerase sigma factor [Cellvibrio fibrivorans]MDR7089034.1 RNA polymerase sigma-70 factor (ECF subfamily) [Cellvibrio fibrivorans]
MPAKILPLMSSSPAESALDAFLASVEARAYRSALLTTKKSADALDIVQEAMLHLVQSYRARDSAEWPLLFQRILQHKILDWHRAQTKQRRWFWQVPANVVEDESESVIDTIVDDKNENPAEIVARAQDINRVLDALAMMPLRQRQVFLLRAWEGFDVASTASVMACSEGSVKTHYFRALQFMRTQLLLGE